jgi:hypothetical protein
MERNQGMSAQILETTNYDMFDLHPMNRNLGTTKHLRESMKKYGFLDHKHINVVRNGGKKLLIKEGHHRFHVAKELGLPIKYVIGIDVLTIAEDEKIQRLWSLKDYLTSYVRAGNPHYILLNEYHEKTGIGLALCLSMLMGNTAGSHATAFKSGTFTIKNTHNAQRVADIVGCMKENGCTFATNHYIVRALSRFVFTDSFNSAVLKQKIKTFPHLIKKQATLKASCEMLESLYNYKSQGKVPLTFLADEAGKLRSVAQKK